MLDSILIKRYIYTSFGPKAILIKWGETELTHVDIFKRIIEFSFLFSVILCLSESSWGYGNQWRSLLAEV